MGLFDIFKKKAKDTESTNKVAIQFTKNNYSRGKSVEPNLSKDVIKCTNLISRTIASTALDYIYTDTKGEVKKWNEGFMKILKHQPNNVMSYFDLMQKTVNAGLLNNDSYIWLVRNGLGDITEFIPITHKAGFERLVVPEGYPDITFVEFTLRKNGQKLLVAEEDLLHFRFRFCENDYFGDSNAPLKEVVSVDSDLWQSVVNWSKNSAALRGVLAANGVLKDEDIKKVNDRMKETFLDSENSGGFLVVDNKFTFTQISSNASGIDRNYLNMTKEDIFQYFGVNEKLIGGVASPQEIQAFHYLTIKPILSMIESELNRKLISMRELGFNHHFLFIGDNLQHLSPSDKNSTVTLLSNLGCLTRNEIREGYGYFPIPGGDVLVYSKNFAEVKETEDNKSDDKTDEENGKDKSKEEKMDIDETKEEEDGKDA